MDSTTDVKIENEDRYIFQHASVSILINMLLKNQKQVIENFLIFSHVGKSYVIIMRLLAIIMSCVIRLRQHGGIIQIRITCKKMCCYMGDSACRLRIAENTKIF